MQPTWPERVELTLIFAAMAAAMAAASRWLPRTARRFRSIRVTVAVLALAAFSIVVAGVLAAGNRMFLSSHDLTLLLVVIAFGMVSAVGFALTVSSPLTADIEHLARSADKVAAGYREKRLEIDRNDEIGRLSVSLEGMIDQLEASDAARRDFFTSVGHDLRTPIASIRAAVESIRDGVVDNPEQRLETIEMDIGVLSGLVEDIYLLARLESEAVDLQLSEVDITELVDETFEVFRPIAERKAVCLKAVASERVIVLAAAEQLSRVLRNLVDNAIRHTRPGSTVTVRLERRGGSCTATVDDEGDGFKADFVPIAFDRFSRPDADRARATGGSGLGLAIAKELVDRMGGHIWIEDGDHGSVVLSLPAATPSRPRLAVESQISLRGMTPQA